MIVSNTITGNGAGSGGGVYCANCSPTITDNTITGNIGSTGGGIYCFASSATIANSIVALNSSGVYSTGSGTLSLRYNCVYENGTSNYSGVSDPTGSNGNISTDPKLANAIYGNNHIQPDSPCLNAGDDSVLQSGWVDMDGQPRKQGAHVDIGADESDGTVWTEGPTTIVRVSPGGNDANDGSSWALAKQTVQAGIDVAAAAGGEVWVAAGTYVGRIKLLTYTHIYGGFAGDETQRSERDWSGPPDDPGR